MELLNNKTVAVIGCGGLGCNIATHLAGAGIGKMILCDYDTVNISNLNRQFLYKLNDIGKSKVSCAVSFIRAYNGTTVTEYNKKIVNTSDMDFCDNCDIIFLAVDNNTTRKTVTEYCTEKHIPLINGGINEFYGTSYLYIPDYSPCPDCAGILYSENKNIISVSSTVGIIGAHEAALGIKYLLGNGTKYAGILYIYDNSTITKLPIRKNTDCKICNLRNEVYTNG